MACMFCVRLRLFALHHPPLVMFLLCTLALAATFLCFGVYIRTYPVKDADFTKMLSAAAICPQRNVSATDVSPYPVQGSPVSLASDIGSLSVLVSVTLSPWQPSANGSGLQISATASQLGMKGPVTDPHLLLTVSSSWWSAQCNNSDPKCSGKFCVTVTGPQSALPLSWSHYQCSAPNPSGHKLLQEVYVMEGGSGTSKCYRLHYIGDPDLKAKMSQEDSFTCSSRLLIAMSVCLLVALMLFVGSACCIHPTKDKRTPGAL
ncbi:uncharacterized protein LOC130284604 isoform X2 [Hyla sarda]|uniref:uncharacterized protein LOC130284604 isoform X2 n=1 Tax=Hyla sarda TaxID=327740 RepID=UPI0024C40AB7|nr:uncharacterized protein LOC130284604 isoform X2 [Hyla sarda]